MKWIGQHIWDFISRFRSHVYLEATESGTIASGGNLGLDSNNKVVKSASPSGTIDLTSEVTGTLPISSGGTGQTTAQAAIDALAGGVNSGKYLRGNGANVQLSSIQAVDVPTLNQDTSGEAATVATIAGLAPNTATSQATQPNITTMTGFVTGSANQLITDDGDGTVTSEANLTFSGSTFVSTAAVHTQTNAIAAASVIHNSGNNNFGGQLTLQGTRGGLDAQDDDIIGTIVFQGIDDGTPSPQLYGKIQIIAADATSNEEAGRMEFKVAEFNGTSSTIGLLIDGDTDEDGEIDVTIGAGSGSTATIAGNLVVTGTPTVGWHGSHTTIKILHSDFSADDGGRPVMIDDVDEANENFFLETHGTFKAYATIAIPTGYKATHVMVYGTNTPAVEVWEHQINSKTGVSKGTGNVDTAIDIVDVNSTATNYLLIQVAQASGDEIHGGYVTIATI